MEMVKYLAIAAALMASLMIAEQAQARGRRGCSSCGGGYVANGCPGGSCYAPVAPDKYSSIDSAPPGLAPAPAVTPAPVVTTQPATNNYYYNASAPRRGLFGRR
jgi:hypothetical protein